jgi:hypothetical protein
MCNAIEQLAGELRLIRQDGIEARRRGVDPKTDLKNRIAAWDKWGEQQERRNRLAAGLGAAYF